MIFCHFLEEVLKKEGVETRGMRFDEQARTTLAVIGMPDENTAEFVFYRNPGADTRLTPAELDRQLIQESSCLHFGSLSLTDEPIRSAIWEAIQVARSAGALISFDVNYRPSLWRSRNEAVQRVMDIVPTVDLLKVNETELTLLTGLTELEAACRSLLEHGPDLCVVTLGPKGSYFQTNQDGEFIPAFKVHTVDATGCGDAFIAGMLFQLVKDTNPLEDLSTSRLKNALRYGNAVGALTAQTLGVIPALPTASQVEAFLRQFN
jgi:sugar/nucleoside kinase (ribokinase family)